MGKQASRGRGGINSKLGSRRAHIVRHRRSKPRVKRHCRRDPSELHPHPDYVNRIGEDGGYGGGGAAYEGLQRGGSAREPPVQHPGLRGEGGGHGRSPYEEGRSGALLGCREK